MNWFIRQVRLHFDGPMRDVDDDNKFRYLLQWTGVEGQKISDIFSFRRDEERTVKAYITYFKQYVRPTARHELLQCRQSPDEPAHTFLKRLHQIAKQCEYEQAVEDTLIVDLYIRHAFKVSSEILNQEREWPDYRKSAETEEAEAIHVPLEDSSTHTVQAKSRPTQCGYCSWQHPHGECPARWENIHYMQ